VHVTLLAAAENRPDMRYVWRGPSLLVVEPHGWAGAHPLTGWYFRQCRFLKELLCSSAFRDRTSVP
jgi:hypothetical protein